MSGPTPVVPGRTVGHYTILQRLGAGGMGEVFRALDRKLDRHVALKVLSADLVSDAERLRLFEREAKALAALNHPNIVTIFSVEEAENSHLLVMEFVEGETLRQTIAPGGIALHRFFDVAIPLSEALAVAHRQGVTHRDLKPENVMLTLSGRVKVLDFGLAKFAAAPAFAGVGADSLVVTLAGPGAVLGTVPYMSPEQAEGRPVDHRSDIFSLGVVLYELLAGERPFRGDSALHVMASILRDRPRAIEELRPDVPAPLARMIHLCLEKDPRSRVQSAWDLRERFEDLARDIEIARTPGSGRRRPDRMRSLPTEHPEATSRRALDTKAGLTALLAVTFIVNWIETTLESALKNGLDIGTTTGYEIARAQRWLEGGVSFERHDLTNPIAVYGYATAYFFVLPLLLIAVLLALAVRDDVRPFRIYCFTLSTTYVLSLAFYAFFPVPERWAFPESDAILLSDLWSSKLIAAIRPISGLDNCFPSFHVASACDAVLLCYLFQLRYRTVALFLASAVLLSTFVLGIHWTADILAGLCVAVISVWTSLRIDRRLARAALDRTAAVTPAYG